VRQLNRTTVTNAVLAVILVALCGWLALFAVRGSEAAPGSTPTEKLADQYSDISRAAHSETLAFLAIDHKRMDELTQRVLDGATGTFEKQYKASLKSLKETAVSQESISKGHVDEVGVSEVEGRTATVFVAAGGKVQNKGTEGKVEDRSWRIKLTMSKEHGRWLVSQLEFVG
jgi:Mce-associated membrane protein